MEFCHIAPKKYIHLIENHNRHLTLAHLVDQDITYTNIYKDIKKKYNSTIIMDNSAFELFKANKPMFEPEKLVDLGKKIDADIIVLPDYPEQDSQKTIDAGLRYAEIFHKNGFKTFFVPQSKLGDLDGYLKCMEFAINNNAFDVIGLSILGCPIALGLKENKYGKTQDGLYKMQRYLSRFRILMEMKDRGLLTEKAYNRFHCLGMTEGPRELQLLSGFKDYIQSWDTSNPVWHGINGIRYDLSSTGLKNGKLESEVDFNIDFDENRIDDIMYNVQFIDNLVENLY